MKSYKSMVNEDTTHRNAARHTIRSPEIWQHGGYDIVKHHEAIKRFMGKQYDFHKASAAISTNEMDIARKHIYVAMYGKK